MKNQQNEQLLRGKPVERPVKHRDGPSRKIATKDVDSSQLVWAGFRRPPLWLYDRVSLHRTSPSGPPEFLKLQAKLYEREGLSSLAKQNLKRVRQLRDLEKRPGEAGRRLMRVLDKAEEKAFPDVFIMCQNGDGAVLEFLATRARKYCEHLNFLAEHGNEQAARHIAQIAISTTTKLGLLYGQNPHALVPVALRELAWPVMVSPNPRLGTPVPDWEAFGLGARFPFKLDARRRFNLRTEVGKIAWKLWLYVFNLKCDAEFFLEMNNIDLGTFKRMKKNLIKISICDEAVLLPEFSNDSGDTERWWALAQRCLISDFPNPDNPQLLNEKAPILDNLVKAASHRKTPAKQRSRILFKLKVQFDAIAGFTDRKKKKS